MEGKGPLAFVPKNKADEIKKGIVESIFKFSTSTFDCRKVIE